MRPTPEQAQRFIRAGTYLFVFGLVLAILPFTPAPSTDIKYLLIAVAAAAFATVRAFARGGAPELEYGLGTGMLPYLFVLINLVAMLASSHMLNAAHAVARVIALALLFGATAYAFHAPTEIFRLMQALVLAVSCSSVYGFVQKAGLDPFPWAMRDVEEYWDVPATFGNPNVAAYTLVMALILAVGMTFRRGSRWNFAFVILLAAHLIMTNVRSGVIALSAAACLTTVGFVLRRTTKPVIAAPLALTITVAAGAVLCIALVVAVRAKAHTSLPTDSSLILRYNSNLGASRMIFDKPVLGFGPGNYSIDSPPYWTPYEQQWYATKNMMNFNVHNDIIETGVESGVPGMALFVSLLVVYTIYALYLGCASNDADTRRIGFVLAACFIAFAVDSMFGFNYRSPVSGAVLFLLAGMLEGLLRQARKARSAAASRLASLAFRVTLVLLAIACLAPEVSAFTSQVLVQRATAAKYWGYPLVAFGFLERAQRLAPWNQRISVELGEIALQQQRPDYAAAQFDDALRRNPNWIPAHTGRAKAYLALAAGQPSGTERSRLLESAQASIDTALRLCPSDPLTQEVLGGVWLLRAEKADEQTARNARMAALVCFRQTQLNSELDTDRSRVSLKAATTHLALGETEDAAHAFTAAIESDPSNEAAWRAYYTFAVDKGDFGRLIAALTSAKARIEATSPHSAVLPLVYTLLDRARRHANVDTSAGALARHAIELAPDHLEAWSELALSNQPENRLSVIERTLETVVRRSTGGAPPAPEPIVALVAMKNVADMAGAAQRLSQSCAQYAHEVGPARATEDCAWMVELAWRLARRQGVPQDIQMRVSATLMDLAQYLGLTGMQARMRTEAAP